MRKLSIILIFILIFTIQTFAYQTNYVRFSDEYIAAEGIDLNETYERAITVEDDNGDLTRLIETRSNSNLYEDQIPSRYSNLTLNGYKELLEEESRIRNPPDPDPTIIISYYYPETGETISADSEGFGTTAIDCSLSCNQYYSLTGYYCDSSNCYATCERSRGCKDSWDRIGSESDYDMDRGDDVAETFVEFDVYSENEHCSGSSCFVDWCYKVSLDLEGTVLREGYEDVRTSVDVEIWTDEDITNACGGSLLDEDEDTIYMDGRDKADVFENHYIWPYNRGYSCSNLDEGDAYFTRSSGEEDYKGYTEARFDMDEISGYLDVDFYAKPWFDADSYNVQCTRPDCTTGACCENPNYKPDGAQPTGVSDTYSDNGEDSATGTNYCVLQDYSCTGSSATEYTTEESTVATCGKCQYCSGSGCENYPAGTDCGGGDICNDVGQCVNCNVDTDCGINGWNGEPSCRFGDVYQDFGDYTCQRPGQTNSYCSGGISTTRKIDCRGTQTCESGACLNVCDTDTDCGIDQYTGDPFCSSDDVFQRYIEYTCENPGTENSRCDDTTSNQLRLGCGETTEGTWGEPHCLAPDGNVVRTRYNNERGCSSDSCYGPTSTPETEIVTSCSYGCQDAECVVPVCLRDLDCGYNYYFGERFCGAGDDIYQQFYDYDCVNPRTAEAYCDFRTYSRERVDCDFGCIEVEGDDQCDPNGPPSITDKYVSSTEVQRTTDVTFTCEVSDPNGWDDVNYYTVWYRDTPSGSWSSIPSTYTQFGSLGKVEATVTLAEDASLDNNYNFRCYVRDTQSRSKSSYLYNAFTAVDYPLEFTIPVSDHTEETAPATTGTPIHFTTNIYDPDSQVKLLICDNQGNAGLGCRGQQYCSDGYKSQGEFACYFDTSSTPSGSYPWTSFAINDLSTVVSGNSGEFYIIGAPLNPSITLDGQHLWSRSGYFSGTRTFSFNLLMQQILDDCDADEGGLCTIPLRVSSDSAGFLDIYDLRIQYRNIENSAPQLYTMEDIYVNEGRLVTIEPEAYDPNGDDLVYTISAPVGNDGIWQTTEEDDGVYEINITVSDGEFTDEISIMLYVRELLDPGVGGIIEYGDVIMTVPAGALPPDDFTDIQISEVTETDYMEENYLEVVGRVYRFTPSGMIFNPPVQVEISYDEDEVENEENIDAFLYKLIDSEEEVYRWVPLGADVDTENNVLLFELTHFSEYAIQEVVADIVAPTVEIRSPLDSVYFAGRDDIALDYVVEDNGVSEPRVDIYLDDTLITEDEFIFSDLLIGSHKLEIVATDNFNNSATDTVDFLIRDVEAPLTTVDVSNDWNNEHVLVDLVVREEGLDTFYCVDQLNTCLPTFEGNRVVVTENGINFLRYYSTDGINREVTQSVVVKIDIENPVIIVDGVANGTEHNLTEETTITLLPQDDESGVSLFTCYFDGEECSTEIIIDEQGEHTLEFQVTDLVGLQSELYQYNINLDSFPPTTTSNIVERWINRGQLDLTLTCTDSGSGCFKIFFEDQVGDVISIDQGSEIEYHLSFEEDDITEHQLNFNAVDNFGNEEELNTLLISVDDIPPVVHIDAPLENYEFYSNDLIDFIISSSDIGSGVEQITTLINEVEFEPESELIESENLILGENEITVIVEDNVGNVFEGSTTFDIEAYCSAHIDCGEDIWEWESSCEDGDLEGTFSGYYILNTCEYPATAQAYCDSERELRLEVNRSCTRPEDSFIVSTQPDNPVIMNEGETVQFRVVLDETLEGKYKTFWALDGKVVTTKRNFDYTPGYTNQGKHRITLFVKKGNKKERVDWNVKVKNVPTYNYPNLVPKDLQVFFPALPSVLTRTYFNFFIENVGLEKAEDVEWIFDPLHQGLGDNEYSDEMITSTAPISIEPDDKIQVHVSYIYEAPYEGEVFVQVISDSELETEDNIMNINISVIE
jgi:hypothetical protein